MQQPVILISGASRGIGLAAARQLSARGAIVLVSSRSFDRAQQAAAAMGGAATALQLDVTDECSIALAVSEVATRFGRLDVLVNNAAVLLDHHESISLLKREVLSETFATNVSGALCLAQAMLPLLEKSSDPRIINVSSRAGQLGSELQTWAPAYSMSKSALNMLTQQLAAAYPGIAVNSMCPGWCRTEMGGPDAPRSADEGADTLVWLAMDAPHALRGNFIKNRETIHW